MELCSFASCGQNALISITIISLFKSARSCCLLFHPSNFWAFSSLFLSLPILNGWTQICLVLCYKRKPFSLCCWLFVCCLPVQSEHKWQIGVWRHSCWQQYNLYKWHTWAQTLPGKGNTAFRSECLLHSCSTMNSQLQIWVLFTKILNILALVQPVHFALSSDNVSIWLSPSQKWPTHNGANGKRLDANHYRCENYILHVNKLVQASFWGGKHTANYSHTTHTQTTKLDIDDQFNLYQQIEQFIPGCIVFQQTQVGVEQSVKMTITQGTVGNGRICARRASRFHLLQFTAQLTMFHLSFCSSHCFEFFLSAHSLWLISVCFHPSLRA